jgi:hypothetical protein
LIRAATELLPVSQVRQIAGAQMKASELIKQLNAFFGQEERRDVGADVDVIVSDLVNGGPTREIEGIEFTDENLITIILKPLSLRGA